MLVDALLLDAALFFLAAMVSLPGHEITGCVRIGGAHCEVKAARHRAEAFARVRRSAFCYAAFASLARQGLMRASRAESRRLAASVSKAFCIRRK